MSIEDSKADGLFGTLSLNERWITAFVLFALASFGLFDFRADLRAGSPLYHLVTEGVLSIAGLIAALALTTRVIRMRAELHQAHGMIADYREDAERWKAESSRLMAGLSQAIEAQFQRWKFSPAEREVALLLLKGFSLKEIADFRSVSERTVRQQSVAIYEKSGTGGRAQLSAFFLEDLLLPSQSMTREQA